MIFTCPHCGKESEHRISGKPKPGYSGFLKHRLSEILALDDAGQSCEAIAAEIRRTEPSQFNYTPTIYGTTIRYILHRMGREPRPHEVRNHTERNRRIVEKYLTGTHTQSAIAKEFNVSKQVVSLVIRKHHREIARMISGDPLLGLSERTTNCLLNSGLLPDPPTFESIKKLRPTDLLGLPNFGRHSLNELQNWIDCKSDEQP